jgi:hypothetical protein
VEGERTLSTVLKTSEGPSSVANSGEALRERRSVRKEEREGRRDRKKSVPTRCSRQKR